MSSTIGTFTRLLSPAIIGLITVVCFMSSSFGAEANPVSCPISSAEYKPHPSYFAPGALPNRNVALDFIMTVHEPLADEKGGSHRTKFFHIDAFDNSTGEKVSTLRMADACSNGIVRCWISTSEGQFHSNDELKELKSGMSFEIIALDQEFFKIPYYGPEAPYVFILPNTANVIHAYYRKDEPAYQQTVEEFVRFHTDEKVFPNFWGYDVWIRDSCKSSLRRSE